MAKHSVYCIKSPQSDFNIKALKGKERNTMEQLNTEKILKDMEAVKRSLSLMAKRSDSITLDRAVDKLNDAIELVSIYTEDKDND